MKRGQSVLTIIISVIFIIFVVLCMFDKENGHSICALISAVMLLINLYFSKSAETASEYWKG